MAATGSDLPPPGDESAAVAAAPASRPRRRWLLRAVLAGAVAVLVAFGTGVLFLASEPGLRLVVAEVVAASAGRLTVDGVEGSLIGTIRARELAWRGPEATVVATDVAIEWSPLALWSRRVAIRGLGAQRIAIEMKPSSGATAPPDSLALPLEVSIDGVAVAELAWRIGPQQGRVVGLTFGYAGGAAEHSIRSLRFAHDFGTLAGNVTLASAAPFALSGDANFTGDGDLAGVQANASFGGTLPDIAVSAKGSLRDALLVVSGKVTPFAEHALGPARLTLADLDLATLFADAPANVARCGIRPGRPGRRPDGDRQRRQPPAGTAGRVAAAGHRRQRELPPRRRRAGAGRPAAGTHGRRHRHRTRDRRRSRVPAPAAPRSSSRSPASTSRACTRRWCRRSWEDG